MKKLKILLSTIIGFLSVGALATGFTYAWLSTATTIVDFDNAGGGVVSSYFHCGSGTEEDPYVITRPVHLYNLVELMYADSEYFEVYNRYFQLGYNLDGNVQDLEFYDYDDSGVLQIDTSAVPNKPKTTKVLNMAYYSGDRALLPIGQFDETKNYPFSGHFDGSSLTIANLEVKGDGKTGIDDLGFFGYVTENASIHDLYIDSITIDVSTVTTGVHIEDEQSTHVAEVGDQDVPCANVGYIAGHIQSSYSFENVYVNNSEIIGTGAVHITNDWGYFGKCDNAGTLQDFIGHAGAEDPSWGGSVNMKKMYDRLYDIADNYTTTNNNYAFEKDIVTKVDGTTFERDALTGYAYTYRDREEGSFVFTRYSTNAGPLSNYMYLNGGTRYHQFKQTETTSNTGFTIRSGNGNNARYLGIQNGAIANVQTGWFIDSSDRLAAYVNDTLYFLNHNCRLVSDTTDTWTKTTNTIYYTDGSGWWGTTYYLTYRNNRWQAYEGGWNTPTLTLTNTTVTKIDETSNGADYMDYSGSNVTYFPLITEEDSYAVTGKNTGYVIAGSEDNTTAAYPDKTGDIRVSKYGTNDIRNSYSNGKLTTVYTINSSLSTVQINPTDYEKYATSKEGFLDSIVDTSIYGLHFMPANININHLVSAEYTLINGGEKSNYQMPASSIDFNLMEKGFINFFAGTYFSGNNSFFSLHHIERDENDNIESIKEIAEIYESTNTKKKYIYKYSDNSYSGTLDDSYSLTFSTARIKKQSSITQNAVYYFEIPVNEGEYALGSVSGGTGAYLMYLDIGTNGGIDYNQDAKTFGKVDFRSAPDVLGTVTENGQEKELNTMLLITYQQPANTTINLKVVYTKQSNRYDITCTGTIGTITITVLDVNIVVYYNGEVLPQQLVSNIKNVPTA